MNFDGNFNKIGDFDVSRIARRVSKITDDIWETGYSRGDRFEVHSDTRTIRLVFDFFRHARPEAYPMYLELQDIVDPILKQIADYYDESEGATALGEEFRPGHFLRILLVKLLPERQIPRHRDYGETLQKTHRLHIPIITNDGCFISVGRMTKCLQQGEIWEINNRRAHAARNKSKLPRVHLIADYRIPGEQILDNNTDASKNALIC